MISPGGETKKWIKLKDKEPKKGEIYWTYPTLNKDMVYPLKWDGFQFASGSYKPLSITHYREIELIKPKPPEDHD